MSIAVVVGNPKAGSRTLRVAMAVADAFQDIVEGESTGPYVVDLAVLGRELFDVDSPAVTSALAAVAHSDLLVVASPTYKATYTGLLKSFFDRYGNDALAGTVSVPVMTGAAPVHALAVEVHLRPLLVELGSSTPTRGLFVTEQQFEDLDDVVASWARVARPLVDRALGGT
ncbi:MAG: NAD(P)H-dependent oxidoreductase [Acidimicrobiales bacterium]|jgi:FMN reductase